METNILYTPTPSDDKTPIFRDLPFLNSADCRQPHSLWILKAVENRDCTAQQRRGVRRLVGPVERGSWQKIGAHAYYIEVKAFIFAEQDQIRCNVMEVLHFRRPRLIGHPSGSGSHFRCIVYLY